MPTGPNASPAALTRDLALSGPQQADLFAFLRRLVACPSLPGDEEAALRLAATQAERLGLPTTFDGLGSLVLHLEGEAEGPCLLFAAHLDTVSGSPEMSVHTAEGMLYGRGTADAKAAAAALLYGAASLAQAPSPLRGRAVFVFGVHHTTCEGAALRHVIETEGISPDFVLLAEPTDLRVMRAGRGRATFTVTVRGQAAAAAQPELGRSAIEEAMRLIFGLSLLETASDPFMGEGGWAVTGVEAIGPGPHSLAECCQLRIDRALTLGETAKRAQAQLEGLIARERLDAQVELAQPVYTTYTEQPVSARAISSPWALEPDHPLIRAVSTAAALTLGSVPPLSRCTLPTAAAFTVLEAGIPTAAFGPGRPEVAHTSHECVSLEDTAAAAHVYTNLGALVLGKLA